MPFTHAPFSCGVCSAAPAGFGWMLPRPRVSTVFSTPNQALPKHRERQRFCSMACQSRFTCAIQRGDAVNREQLDHQAKQDALNALGDYVMQVGIHKPLSDYSKMQAQGIVTAVLKAYQHSLKTHFPKES